MNCLWIVQSYCVLWYLSKLVAVWREMNCVGQTFSTVVTLKESSDSRYQDLGYWEAKRKTEAKPHSWLRKNNLMCDKCILSCNKPSENGMQNISLSRNIFFPANTQQKKSLFQFISQNRFPLLEVTVGSITRRVFIYIF